MPLNRCCDHCGMVLDGDVSLWVDSPSKTISMTCDQCSIDHCHFVLGEHMPMAGGDFQSLLPIAQDYLRQGFNRGGPRLRGSD